MKHAQFWMKPENFKVVGFYPYTSSVTNRIWEQSHNYKVQFHDEISAFGQAVEAMAVEIGCRWDNKVVVELEFKGSDRFFNKHSNLFVGWYDGKWSIGMGVFQPDSYTQKYNQVFEEEDDSVAIPGYNH